MKYLLFLLIPTICFAQTDNKTLLPDISCDKYVGINIEVGGYTDKEHTQYQILTVEQVDKIRNDIKVIQEYLITMSTHYPSGGYIRPDEPKTPKEWDIYYDKLYDLWVEMGGE
jgi:hypothetical protein